MSAVSAGRPAGAGALAGRVVLLVGAHGGLGQSLARACSAAGASLVLLGRRVPRLTRLQDALRAGGSDTVLYPLDLEGAGPDDYAQMAARIEAEFGRLDGVAHCAADFPGLTPLQHADPAAFARTLHVNVTASWWLSQACLPLLIAAEDSALLFVVDDPGRTTAAYWGAYGIAQQARIALVRILHQETRNGPLRVHGYQPPPLRTALRARAYAADGDRQAADPAGAAADCVRLLSVAGADARGLIQIGAMPV